MALLLGNAVPLPYINLALLWLDNSLF